MTMKIGGILAAAILIAAVVPVRAQETYPTPEAAVKDLVDSAKAKTPGFGDRILGKDGAALLRSGDADEDAENLKEFNEAAAGVAPISASSTTSCCSGGSTTALAIIASSTTAATRPLSG